MDAPRKYADPKEAFDCPEFNKRARARLAALLRLRGLQGLPAAAAPAPVSAAPLAASAAAPAPVDGATAQAHPATPPADPAPALESILALEEGADAPLEPSLALALAEGATGAPESTPSQYFFGTPPVEARWPVVSPADCNPPVQDDAPQDDLNGIEGLIGLFEYEDPTETAPVHASQDPPAPEPEVTPAAQEPPVTPEPPRTKKPRAAKRTLEPLSGSSQQSVSQGFSGRFTRSRAHV